MVSPTPTRQKDLAGPSLRTREQSNRALRYRRVNNALPAGLLPQQPLIPDRRRTDAASTEHRPGHQLRCDGRYAPGQGFLGRDVASGVGTASGRRQQERAGAGCSVCQHSAVRVVGTGCCADEMEMGGALAGFMGLVVWGEGEAIEIPRGFHSGILLSSASVDSWRISNGSPKHQTY